ncbi:MAG: 2-oxoacid:acceptor oxidoreductase family protein [Desulfobacteraceae bacterium]|nr:2-oxoacid:acceptor oxidoreductase family protein [Desulfobacteraceae bacterium]
MKNRNGTERKKREILITGFGGQGIVLAGQVLGTAASLKDRLHSTLTQSYGPEARGGACSAQVIIADGPIHYPYVDNPDILVCMSQTGYDKYYPFLKENGVLIFDQDLVRAPEKVSGDLFPIPATRIAEELGRKMMANIVMLGFVTAVTGAASLDAMLASVADSVPKGTEESNTAAFTKGFDFGQALLKGRERKAAGRKGAAS